MPGPHDLEVLDPRRQQLRRLGRAAAIAAAGLAATVGAVAAPWRASRRSPSGCCSLRRPSPSRARHWRRLRVRSGVGARSESEVQRALSILQREGWRLRRSLRWRGRGDIDHVAIAPTGIAFAIEAKTSRYNRVTCTPSAPRPPGSGAAADAGAPAARSRSSASPAPSTSSAASSTCSSSPSTRCCPRCAPPLYHPTPVLPGTRGPTARDSRARHERMALPAAARIRRAAGRCSRRRPWSATSDCRSAPEGAERRRRPSLACSARGTAETSAWLIARR